MCIVLSLLVMPVIEAISWKTAVVFTLASFPAKSAASKEKQEEESSCTSSIGKVLLIGGGAVAGAAALPAIAGFGAAGVVGGSLAAATQATIGNVAAGSAFAAVQSMAASGVFASAGYVGGATAAVGAALSVSGKKNDGKD